MVAINFEKFYYVKISLYLIHNIILKNLILSIILYTLKKVKLPSQKNQLLISSKPFLFCVTTSASD